MQLNSFPKLYLFIGIIFLIGFLIVEGLSRAKRKNRNIQTTNAFFWVLFGTFVGVAGDVALLQYPVKNFPKLAELINSTFLVILFFALPAIGGVFGVLVYSIFVKKTER